MRKISLIGLAMLIVSIPTFAGDYLTNTNQNIRGQARRRREAGPG